MSASNDHPGAGQPLMRSLGECVGAVWHAIKTPVDAPARVEVARREQTARVETPRGPVVLRRTVIDEIEPEKPDTPQ
ncbi:MAG TPA: hypothetical protein VD971_12200 [Phycisphaerales bacterium]|nr:hypothetical protein [Phycisphaerales bacterium]